MNKIYKTLLLIFFIIPSMHKFAYADTEQKGNKRVEEFIYLTTNKVVKVITEQIPEGEKYNKLEKLFFSVMDIDWISRFVVTKYYNDMNNEQKLLYNKYYKRYLSHFYIKRFTEYNNQDVKIVAIRKVRDDEYIVVTNIIQRSNSFVVAYKVKENGGHFKIRDIIAENISLIVSQRSEFNSIIAKNGINKLIQMLKNK